MTEQNEKPHPAEYLLGLTDDEEAAAAEHEANESADFQADVADWAKRFAPLDGTVTATVTQGLWSAIEARVQEIDAVPGIRTVQPEAGVWETITTGVARKIVYQDQTRNMLCYFVRLDAGATLPKHGHPGDEHCVVLEGTLRMGDTVFGPGSYQFAAEGAAHPPVTAESTALLFIQGLY